MVNPRHQTSQGQSVAKPETPLQNIQVEQLGVTKKGSDGTYHVESDILKEGPWTKTSWGVRDRRTPNT